MWRVLALVLLLANALYFTWAQGLLAPYGWRPAPQSEPERLAQQVQPDLLQVLDAETARRAEQVASAAARASECLLAGLFDDSQAANLRLALASFPAETWQLDPVVEPAHWIVYMGRYPGTEQLDKKKAELRYLRIAFEPARGALEPGLVLGGYPNEAAAAEALAALGQRGVRTARVLQDREEKQGQQLRLLVQDEAMHKRLADLRPALAGRPLRPCKPIPDKAPT